ncbi:MAG: hypothetical protein LRS48_02190 [Desulfurococcales archaeon]|nr:hypothetical protein [Desulfurococcales archaeon]
MGDEKLLNPKIIELEGLAMTGFVSSAKIEDCGSGDMAPNGWKRIVAKLADGSEYRTGCMEPEAAKRNYMVIMLYVRKWGRLISGS